MNNLIPISDLDTESRKEYFRLSKRISRLRMEQEGASKDDIQRMLDRLRYIRDKDNYKAKAKIWNQKHPAYMRAMNMTNRVKALYPDTFAKSSITFEALEDWWQNHLDSDCVYCGAAATCADHVTPLCKGGVHEFENIVPCCRQCNSSKGSSSFLDFYGRVKDMYLSMSKEFDTLSKELFVDKTV